MAYELIKVSELPELTTPSDPNVLPIQDGDYLKRISFENLKEAATGDVAGDLAAEVTAREGAVSGEATTRANADAALAADLASAYSTSATYAVGDYCTKDGQLYRCTTAITTAEAWTAAHWSAVALGNDTRDLSSVLINRDTTLVFEQGNINASGEDISATNRIRGIGYIYCPFGFMMTVPTGYKAYFRYYNSNTAASISGNSDGWLTGDINITAYDGQYVRVILANSADTALTPSDVTAPIVITANCKTDTTLTQKNVSADANETGNQLSQIKSNYIPAFVTDYINGKYVRYDTGATDSLSGMKIAEMSVIPASKIKYSFTLGTPDVRGLAFYRKDGTFITGSGVQALATSQEITVPNKAYTCKATVRDTNQLVSISNSSSLVDYIRDFAQSTPASPYNVISGKYVYWDSGAFDVLSSMNIAEMYVTPDTQITYKYKNQNPDHRGLAFYDANGVYISGVQGIATEQTVTCPDNAYICRASVYNTDQIVYAQTANDIYAELVNQRSRMSRFSFLEIFENIDCYGDSLTYGTVYLSPSSTRQAKCPYPKTIEKITGATVENISRGGASASAWWTEFNTRIVSKTNHLVMVYLGTNDGLTDTLDTDAPSGTSYETWADTNTGCYAKIVAKAQEVGAKVLLINTYVSSTNAVIKKIADRLGCGLIENHRMGESAYHLAPNLSYANYLHYNDLGYTAFGHYVVNQIANMDNNYLKNLIPS